MSTGKTIGIVSLTLALLSAIPSAAAFLPAVFLSLLALIIAAISAVLGAVKVSLATMVVVAITVFLISPVSSAKAINQQPELIWVLAIPFVVFFCALVIGWQKKRPR